MSVKYSKLIVLGDGLSDQGRFGRLTQNRYPHFGIQHVAETYLPMDYIDFSNPLAPAKPLPADRIGQNADDYMSFWAVAAGRKVHAVLGERAAAEVAAWDPASQ